jgi:hypothetical protein
VKEYLDSKGPQHRIVFLVDEVGQFIGTDSHLMLNLQTITEELGTICRRRAWIVVTSQDAGAPFGHRKDMSRPCVERSPLLIRPVVALIHTGDAAAAAADVVQHRFGHSKAHAKAL